MITKRIECVFAVLLAALDVWGATPEPKAVDGLVGLWKFDACDGQTVQDTSASKNDGKIVFGNLVNEKSGKSLELDGLGGHVVIVETTPLIPADALSATIWVRPARLSAYTTLFGAPHVKEDWSTPVYGMYAFQNRVVYGMWLNGGRTKVLVESPRELPLNTWTFLAAAYDGQKVCLYVNGVAVAQQPASGRILPNGEPLILGKGKSGSKPSFKGRLGQVGLYGRGLSAAEVQAIYERTKTSYDLTIPVKKDFRDGTVIVETHGNSPAVNQPWTPRPTRTLQSLSGYRPSGDRVKLDRFGGWMDRPAEKATGFFHAEKIQGRSWLIDPDGYRFLHIGINTITEPKDVSVHFGSADRWAEKLAADLKDAGFTGLGGGGASKRLIAAKPSGAWVLHKNFLFAFTKLKKLDVPASGTLGFIDKCIPVFHPEFAPFCDQCAKSLTETAKDPYLLGIMSDNEVQCPTDLLNRFLALDASNPDLKPGREAAEAWLAKRYGKVDPARINQHDQLEFIAYAFDRYYQIVTSAIRKYDPNHMYLGSRLCYRVGQFENPWFWKMLTRYHDAVSVNYYSVWGPDDADLTDWSAWNGPPILVTEWYAKAMDVPGLANTHGAGWLVKTQEDRARYYQHFVLKALESPLIVGWHWFKYRDDPPESQALDNAGGANKGMFDVFGKPHEPLFHAAREVNREAYPLVEFFDARNR